MANLSAFDTSAPMVMPPLPEETKPYYAVVMVAFAVWFFVGIHYRMHVSRHGFPPFYLLWIYELLRKFKRPTQ